MIHFIMINPSKIMNRILFYFQIKKLHTIKQEQMQENFASKRKIEDLQTKIEELEKVNQRWQFVNESLTLQNEKNDEIIEKMNLEKNGWEKEMHILKNVNSDLQQKLDTIKQEQIQENCASEKKFDDLRTKNEEFDIKTQKLELVNTALTAKNENNDKLIETLLRQKFDLVDFKRKFENLQSKNKDLSSQHENNVKIIEKLNHEKIGLEKEKHILKNINHDLQQKLHTMKQEQIQEHFASKRKIEDLQTAFIDARKKFQEKLEQLQKRNVTNLDKFYKEIKIFKEFKKILDSRNFEKDEAIKNLEKEKQILKNINCDLQQKLQKMKQELIQESCVFQQDDQVFGTETKNINENIGSSSKKCDISQIKVEEKTPFFIKNILKPGPESHDS